MQPARQQEVDSAPTWRAQPRDQTHHHIHDRLRDRPHDRPHDRPLDGSHQRPHDRPHDRLGDHFQDWPIGAHLVSPRRGYMHHGLYAGAGRVIHYAGFNRLLQRGPVQEVSLARFSRGRPVAVQPHPSLAYSGEAAVARARSRLGENRYRVWSNNCEHFVHWCLDGAARSSQVERWVLGWARWNTSAALTRAGQFASRAWTRVAAGAARSAPSTGPRSAGAYA